MVSTTASCLIIVVTQLVMCHVAGSGWAEWSRWSECSRTCDGGARYKTRRCSGVPGYDCPDRGIKYTSCNTKPCPPGTPDFRTEQCAAYNDASYSGYSFLWVPYHERKNPCALSCLAEGTNMVAILAPKVLDGTRCRDDSLDMCINGLCVPVGCDHELYSEMQTDMCGVCGGKNSTCHLIDKSGIRFQWIATDFGACSVTCGVGVKERRLLCYHTKKGRVLDPSRCKGVEKPVNMRETCSQGPCPPEWRVGPWQNCTRDCGGGVSWRIVSCIQTFEDGTQQLMRDSACDASTRLSSRKSCNGFICPTWYAGEWSVCSVSCGTGTHVRDVICRHVGDVFCRPGDKPRTVKNCTTGIPCYNLNGDIQERNVGQFRTGSEHELQGDQPDTTKPITKEDLLKPRFVTSTWDACSTSCDEGIRFRYVRCQVFLRYLDDFVDLPDEDCLEHEVKPDQYEACMVEPCYDMYAWVPIGMTECSRTCLGGVQETIFTCERKENGGRVEDAFCLESPRPQVERRICNDKPCPQRWELGEYGECSLTCGGGVMSRSVRCIQEYAQESVLNLPDFMCSKPGPEKVSGCNSKECPAQWAVGNWSECSVTCGVGVMTRVPLCQRERSSGLANVSRSECDVTLKPQTEMTCNRTTCPEPMIKPKNIKLYQLNKINRLKLFVGMEASILPDTTIIVKCPHVGLDRQKVTWFKNGLKFRRSKRAKVARSGALRIRRAFPGRDDAVYSCLIGGLEANLTIKFASSYDVLQATVFREKFLKDGASNHSLLNKTVLYKDPVDRKRKPLTLMSTDWSRCSVTCGGGLQSRNMSCEVITEDYYEVLPKEECFRNSDVKPPLIRSCNVEPCVEWRAGNWSECSIEECVRYHYAKQRRTVECLNLFNDTATDGGFCTDLGFPPDNIRDCFNPNCTVAWKTSKWSECIADCGEEGFKARTFKCVWAGTNRPAPYGSCELLERPRASRACRGPPCSSMVCEDESDQCELAGEMDMCGYKAFQMRCCLTCSAIDEEYDFTLA
ncbi:ADAMTS-like protein 3 isoform X1 [Mya arenaria]|uniref:ADAMTS-like protein 3 isoform X1 n=1 Tax=Mya arenaria TaxID=6604 RepID=UPI0022E1C278|nr:ADAMTS-like protein 3 isoform X1 [Mya arenaria]